MVQVRRWGSWIKWSTAEPDSGIPEVRCVSDGPRRKPPASGRIEAEIVAGVLPKERLIIRVELAHPRRIASDPTPSLW